MAALDPYGVTDQLEDVLLDVMVTRLEGRAKHWFFRKVMREYLDAIEVDSMGAVLEVGCGTGVAARTIARREGFTGRVTGIDLSPYLVQAARRLADQEVLGELVEFRAGDTRDLDIPRVGPHPEHQRPDADHTGERQRLAPAGKDQEGRRKDVRRWAAGGRIL
jgi:SAM-dependent methyltransferase